MANLVLSDGEQALTPTKNRDGSEGGFIGNESPASSQISSPRKGYGFMSPKAAKGNLSRLRMQKYAIIPS